MSIRELVKTMKKNSKSRLGRIIKGLFKVRDWLDWERVKVFGVYLKSVFKTLFVPNTAVETESFALAQKRLKLSDSGLLERQAALLRLSIILVSMAFALFIYTVYLFYSASIKGGGVSFVLMLIALVLAFRYHFWYFQMKERKLGCTIKEWFKQGLMGGKR